MSAPTVANDERTSTQPVLRIIDPELKRRRPNLQKMSAPTVRNDSRARTTNRWVQMKEMGEVVLANLIIFLSMALIAIGLCVVLIISFLGSIAYLNSFSDSSPGESELSAMHEEMENFPEGWMLVMVCWQTLCGVQPGVINETIIDEKMPCLLTCLEHAHQHFSIH